MKGFSFTQIVEDFRDGYFDESVYEQELGENWQRILNGQMPLKQAKEEYLSAQAKKYNDMYTDSILYLNHDDDFLIQNEEVLESLGYTNHSLVQADSNVMNLLQGILTAQDRGLQIQEDKFKDILKGYISTGFNVYPLMRIMNMQMNDYFKANPEVEGLGEMKDTFDGMTILKNIEKESSPYADLFRIAEHLGNLEFQYNELNFGDNEHTDEEIASNDYAIEQAKAMLKEEIGKFDLTMLESVIKNKRNLIRDTELKSQENPLFKGLGRASALLMSLQKEQEKKAEKEGMEQ